MNTNTTGGTALLPAFDKGGFATSLNRNNKQIKAERAGQIAMQAGMIYLQRLQALMIRQRTLVAQRQAHLDLSPESSFGLTPAKDFNPEDWVDKDIDMGLELRDIAIRIEVVQAQYDALFGDNMVTPTISETGEGAQDSDGNSVEDSDSK